MTSNGLLKHRGCHSAQASGGPPLQLLGKNLCASSIVMMEPTQDWQGEDLATCLMCWHGSGFLLRNLLSDPLMRSCLVEVRHIGIEDPLELLLIQDEQMIKAFTPDTAQKAFTDRIGPWRVVGRFQDLDATGLGNPSEAYPKLAIVITDEILRTDTKSGGLPQLLRSPGIGRRASDPTWMTLRDCRSIMKKANSERKNRSVTGRKSQAQICWACVCMNVLHVCPGGLVARTCLMYF
jgi:hypothetical protein